MHPLTGASRHCTRQCTHRRVRGHIAPASAPTTGCIITIAPTNAPTAGCIVLLHPPSLPPVQPLGRELSQTMSSCTCHVANKNTPAPAVQQASMAVGKQKGKKVQASLANVLVVQKFYPGQGQTQRVAKHVTHFKQSCKDNASSRSNLHKRRPHRPAGGRVQIELVHPATRKLLKGCGNVKQTVSKCQLQLLLDARKQFFGRASNRRQHLHRFPDVRATNALQQSVHAPSHQQSNMTQTPS